MLLISVGLNAQVADVNSGDSITAQKMNDIIGAVNNSVKGTGEKICRLSVDQRQPTGQQITADHNNCATISNAEGVGANYINFEPGYFTQLETCTITHFVGDGDHQTYQCSLVLGGYSHAGIRVYCKKNPDTWYSLNYNLVCHGK